MQSEIPQISRMGFFNSQFARPGMKETDEHLINEFQLEFCDTDGGTTYIDGTAYPVRRDMIICAKPGQMRWTRLPFCCYYIKIPKDNLAISPILSGMKDCWTTDHETMEAFLQSFHKLTENGVPNEMRHYSALLSLLAAVAEDSARSPRKGTDEKISQAEHAVRLAENYIDLHYSEKCLLDDISRQAGFSPIYFHKIFKESTGMTPNEYLLKKRLREAKERLSKSDATLSEIAFGCGFGSQSYFQYVFRRETGITPTEYRKIQQQKYLI